MNRTAHLRSHHATRRGLVQARGQRAARCLSAQVPKDQQRALGGLLM